MMSETGRQNFKNQLQQIVGSIQYTNDIDVHIALIQAPSYAKERAERYYTSSKTNHQVIREYIDLFGFMSKNPNAMDIMIEEAKSLLRSWGAKEPTFLLTNSKLTFQMTMIPEKTQYLTQGVDGQRRLRTGPDIKTYRGLQIINSRSMSMEDGAPPRDVLRRRVRVAEYYRIPYSHGVENKSFRLYDESKDAWQTFTWKELYAMSMLGAPPNVPTDPKRVLMTQLAAVPPPPGAAIPGAAFPPLTAPVRMQHQPFVQCSTALYNALHDLIVRLANDMAPFGRVQQYQLPDHRPDMLRFWEDTLETYRREEKKEASAITPEYCFWSYGFRGQCVRADPVAIFANRDYNNPGYDGRWAAPGNIAPLNTNEDKQMKDFMTWVCKNVMAPSLWAWFTGNSGKVHYGLVNTFRAVLQDSTYLHSLPNAAVPGAAGGNPPPPLGYTHTWETTAAPPVENTTECEIDGVPVAKPIVAVDWGMTTAAKQIECTLLSNLLHYYAGAYADIFTNRGIANAAALRAQYNGDADVMQTELVIIRPNIEHNMLGIIMGRGGLDDLGATLWGQTELSCYDDSMHGIWGMSYKYNERAIVFNNKNLIRLWDVAYDGYNGGKDTTHVQWTDPEHVQQFTQDTYELNKPYEGSSMMVMAFSVPTGEATTWPSPIVYHDSRYTDATTGATQPLDGEHMHQIRREPFRVFNRGYYCDRYRQYFAMMPDFSRIHNSKTAGTASQENESSCCSLAFQGTMQVIDDHNNVVETSGNGHHGIDYVGVASVRSGKGMRSMPSGALSFGRLV